MGGGHEFIAFSVLFQLRKANYTLLYRAVGRAIGFDRVHLQAFDLRLGWLCSMLIASIGSQCSHAALAACCGCCCRPPGLPLLSGTYHVWK